MLKRSLNRIAITIAVVLICICVLPMVFIEAVGYLFSFQIPVTLESVIAFWTIAIIFRLVTVRRPQHMLVMRKMSDGTSNK